MREKDRPKKWKRLFCYSIAAVALVAACSALLSHYARLEELLSPLGIVHASSAQRQKDLEDPATKGARDGSSASEAKDAFEDLVDQQPIDREFLRTIVAREKALRIREKELQRREENLLKLQRDIEEKLQRLEKARQELKAMTDAVDEERAKELKDAVKVFRAMEAESAAKSLIQMDLESALSILKGLDALTAGGIFDAMVEVSETGTDSEEQIKKTKRLKEIWERWVNPDKTPEPALPGDVAKQAAI